MQKYEHLKSPQISQKAAMQVIVQERVGDPNETVSAAFGDLYGAYYSLDDAKVEEPWPRSRWDLNIMENEVPMSEWRGTFAVPVAAAVKELPAEYATQEFPIRLETWDYGTVAEMLHIGSYEDMEGSISKLQGFVTEQGYRIAGQHEEEYLKGPGMIFEGNPDEYVTILRYEVVKR